MTKMVLIVNISMAMVTIGVVEVVVAKTMVIIIIEMITVYTMLATLVAMIPMPNNSWQ